jgi:hypothetical protein
MNSPPSKPETKLERLARKMRRSNLTGDRHDHHHAVDANNELTQPDHPRGRPCPEDGRPTNAGNDGGP